MPFEKEFQDLVEELKQTSSLEGTKKLERLQYLFSAYGALTGFENELAQSFRLGVRNELERINSKLDLSPDPNWTKVKLEGIQNRKLTKFLFQRISKSAILRFFFHIDKNNYIYEEMSSMS